MRSSVYVLAFALLTGCQGRLPSAAPLDTAALLADANASGSEPRGTADDARLAEIDRKIEELTQQWQKRLQKPDALSRFFEPGESMAPLLELAKGEKLAPALAKSLTVDHVLAASYVRNPRLRSERKTLAGTVEQYSQVTYLDTIQRQYVSFLRSSHNRLRPTVPMDPIAKRFPFPGTLELKAAIVKHSVEGAYARYEGAVRDVLTEARTAYARHEYLGKAIRITQETVRYLRQLESATRSKLSAGTAEKAHVLQTQVEISGLETDLITLRQERETTRALLNTLMDLPAESPLAEPQATPTGSFPKELEPAYQVAQRDQPDIHRARAMERRIATMIELAEQSAYPDLSAGLAYMEDVSHATLGTDKAREPFGTRPKVRPDPWFGTKEAYLREVRERHRAATDRVKEVTIRTRYKVKDAYVRLSTAKRVHELYRDVQISQAEQAYRDASSGYAADRVGFLNVVDALRRWLRFLLESDRALRDYHIAHARLEGAMGAPVSRLGE